MVLSVLICGGGNAAHVHAGIAASQPGVEVRVLTMFADEAERWTNAMKDNDFVVTFHTPGHPDKNVSAKPKLVSKDPAAVVPGADLICFTVPAFAHDGYLTAIKPHVKPGAVLVGFPGQAGFEFAVFGNWGDLAKECTIMSFESLPWACRIAEFGKNVTVLGTKNVMKGSTHPGKNAPKMDALAMLQQTIGPIPVLKTEGHLLGVTLMSVNGYLHPALMYGRWKDWDGTPVDATPLFYHGMDDYSCSVLSSCSDEVVAIAKGIMQKRPNVDLNHVEHFCEYLKRCYQDDISDKTNLYTVVHTNAAYTGLGHPMAETADGKFVPNYKYRYLTEDIPFGMLVIKGIAVIAGVPTPQMDTVLEWAQKCMGKEYIVGGELTGKDMKDTRTAQRYGLTTLDTMLGLD